MYIRVFLGIITLATLPTTTVLAQNTPPVTALGNITGTLNDKPHEWVTVSSEIGGEHVASANWKHLTFSMPDLSQAMEQMAEFLTPEQRSQLDMLKNIDTGNNPMAAMLNQMAGQQMNSAENLVVTISGHEDASIRSMMKQAMVITVHLDSLDKATGSSLPADLSYITEVSDKGMPQTIYVSNDDDASVVFDMLEIQPEGGHASGRFQGSMCKVDMRNMMQGPDFSDCITAEGTFDTPLKEDKS